MKNITQISTTENRRDFLKRAFAAVAVIAAVKPAAASNVCTRADFERVMNDYRNLFLETVRDFPRMTAEERREVIDETYAVADRCTSQKGQRFFEEVGNQTN